MTCVHFKFEFLNSNLLISRLVELLTMIIVTPRADMCVLFVCRSTILMDCLILFLHICDCMLKKDLSESEFLKSFLKNLNNLIYL